jgi:hypothetical protein
MLKKDKVDNRCTRIFGSICSNWPIYLTLGSGFFLLIGCLYYHITPWYTLKEFGDKQHLNDQKNDFVNFHNDLGIKFLYSKNIDAAREEFNQTLGVDPLNQNAARYKILCDLFNNTTIIAVTSKYNSESTRMRLDELMIKNNTDPLLYLYSGELSFNNREWMDAICYYTKTLQLDPNVAAAYEDLGVVGELEKPFLLSDQENKTLKKAADIAGFEYNKENLSDFTLKMFKKAVDVEKKKLIYRSNLAGKYYELGDYTNAILLYSGSFDPNLDSYISFSNSYRCLGDFENASKIQEKQITLMEENNTKDLAMNHNNFYYRTSSANIAALNTYDEKKYYFYYNIALTNYLFEKEPKAREYVKKANNLNLTIESKSKVKEILDYDILALQKTQSNNTKLINKANEFRNEFVTKM